MNNARTCSPLARARRSSCRTNVIHRPSGEKFGPKSRSRPPRTTRRRPVPSTPTTRIPLRANAIEAPSGEKDGSRPEAVCITGRGFSPSASIRCTAHTAVSSVATNRAGRRGDQSGSVPPDSALITLRPEPVRLHRVDLSVTADFPHINDPSISTRRSGPRGRRQTQSHQPDPHRKQRAHPSHHRALELIAGWNRSLTTKPVGIRRQAGRGAGGWEESSVGCLGRVVGARRAVVAE